MTIRQQIPEVQGIQDAKVRDILVPMRKILNDMTGRSNAGIKTLGATATTGAIINKINEIILVIQDTKL